MDEESLVQIQQVVGTATETLRVEIADAKRHAGVLTEGLGPELQLLAEGFQMHLGRSHADDRAYRIWTSDSEKPARAPSVPMAKSKNEWTV